MTGSHWLWKLILTVITASAASAACYSSNNGVSYTAPDNICGISANKKVLLSLLGDGRELKQDSGYFSITEGQFCHMYVDGNDALVSDAAWHTDTYKLRDLFQDYEVKGLRYLKGGQYASWHRGVATVISCPGASKKGDVVSLEVRDMRWNADSQSLLEQLVPSYFKAYKKKLGCST